MSQIPCAGGCGGMHAGLEWDRLGQIKRVSSWICWSCHRRICGEDYLSARHRCRVRGEGMV